MKDNPVTIRIKSGTKPLWDRYIEELPSGNPEKYLTFAEWINFKVNESLTTLENTKITENVTFVDAIDKTVTKTNNIEKMEETKKVISIEEMFNDDF